MKTAYKLAEEWVARFQARRGVTEKIRSTNAFLAGYRAGVEASLKPVEWYMDEKRLHKAPLYLLKELRAILETTDEAGGG